jgi:hypothetical protein
MHIITLAVAAILTLVSGRDVVGALPFAVPLLGVSGVLQPVPGHRLFIVDLRLGEEPLAAEDISQFALVTARGLREPIGAGASERSIVPFDRIRVGGEVGEVLPSDAMIVITRTSPTRVALEVGPLGTLALLYEVPLGSSVRALRLPDGRELAIAP